MPIISTPTATALAIGALVAAGFAAGAIVGWLAARRSRRRHPAASAPPANDAQTERVERELNGLIYSVSHDVRAPLRSIDGFSQALLEDYGDQLDATANSYLTRVRANTRRINDYIEHLLALARLSRAELRVERVDLSALASGICENLARDTPDHPVVWTVQPGIVGTGDNALLAKCLQQLLDNAWKFSGRLAEARVEFGSDFGPDGERRFFVRDNGAGFDLNYAGRLFGAFQRLHAPDEFPGAGIGLATAQRIVHRHGGRIWAEASPGDGATFFFTLGIETDGGAAARDTWTKARVPRSAPSVLQPASRA